MRRVGTGRGAKTALPVGTGRGAKAAPLVGAGRGAEAAPPVGTGRGARAALPNESNRLKEPPRIHRGSVESYPVYDAELQQFKFK
jgi:hypothetical protein